MYDFEVLTIGCTYSVCVLGLLGVWASIWGLWNWVFDQICMQIRLGGLIYDWTRAHRGQIRATKWGKLTQRRGWD